MYLFRYFQFSLRTMFVVVTLLAIPCGYVAWQDQIVRERKAMLVKIGQLGGGWQIIYDPQFVRKHQLQRAQQLTRSPGYSFWFEYSDDGNAEDRRYSRAIVSSGERQVIPWLRKWMGDQPIEAISIPKTIPPKFAAEVFDAFPESEFYCP